MPYQEHARVRGQFDKLASARQMLDKIRLELTGLSNLGDMVGQEDVIKSAGKMVAAGLSPLALAKLLSDMPQGGQALQTWLSQHAADVTQREAQLEPVLAGARHQLGVAGIRVLLAQAAGIRPQEGQQQPNQATPLTQGVASPSPQPGTSFGESDAGIT